MIRDVYLSHQVRFPHEGVHPHKRAVRQEAPQYDPQQKLQAEERIIPAPLHEKSEDDVKHREQRERLHERPQIPQERTLKTDFQVSACQLFENRKIRVETPRVRLHILLQRDVRRREIVPFCRSRCKIHR